VCASNEESEVDENASQTLAAKSNVAARVFFDGTSLDAQVIGIEGRQTTITLARSTPSYIVFQNESDEDVRLTAHLGAFEVDVNGTMVVQKPVTCTTLVEPDGMQFIELTFPKSSAATLEPYTLAVPGVEAAPITVVVP
jgi:hypothetical protein